MAQSRGKVDNRARDVLEWERIGGASKHTLRAYKRHLAQLIEVLGKEAEHDTLTAFSLQTFMGYLRLAGLGANSRAQTLAAAKSFVSWAYGEGIYPDSFAATVRGPHTCDHQPSSSPQRPAVRIRECPPTSGQHRSPQHRDAREG